VVAPERAPLRVSGTASAERRSVDKHIRITPGHCAWFEHVRTATRPTAWGVTRGRARLWTEGSGMVRNAAPALSVRLVMIGAGLDPV